MSAWTDRRTLLRVPAKDLHIGDFCLGSKETIAQINLHIQDLPPDKVELELTRLDGRRRTARWNRRTRIAILRERP